jgi:hypothetical protein
MASTPKPLRRRAVREVPGLARHGFGVGFTGRLIGAGAVVLYQDDCGHEVLAVPATVHYANEADRDGGEHHA